MRAGADEFRILAPTAILGYGFPLASFAAGLALGPDLIAVDAGSTDPGPYYLGAGLPFTEGTAVERDLEPMLAAAIGRGIPLVIGSAGGAGGAPHLARDAGIIRAIARRRGLRFRLATIGAEVGRERIAQAMRRGEIAPLGAAPELTEEVRERAVRVVGQMGAEPLLAALAAGAQVVLAGRCYDPVVFAAPALARGFDPGLAIHLGKILECGAIAASPGSGSDCLFGRLQQDGFEVETLNPARRCTVQSVAAHTLYEKSDPLSLPGPGGRIELRAVRFEQVAEHRVRVTGSRFVPSEGYFVKLEGVERAGFRAVSIAGCRDPLMIDSIDTILAGVRERVADNFAGLAAGWRLDFRLYGRDGVMGALEPQRARPAHELGIVIEALAATQAAASALCGFARSTLLHWGYPGRVSTAGNLAFPFSPSDFEGGEVFRFSIYHLMRVADPCDLFPLSIEEIG
jgi:hypothetical protein